MYVATHNRVLCVIQFRVMTGYFLVQQQSAIPAAAPIRNSGHIYEVVL
jgi:hypothetical protein